MIKALNHLLGKIRILFYRYKYKVRVKNVSQRLNFYRYNDIAEITFSLKYYSKRRALASFYPVLEVREVYPSGGFFKRKVFSTDKIFTKNEKEAMMVCDVKEREEFEFDITFSIPDNIKPGLYEFRCQIWNPFKARGEYYWRYYPNCFTQTKWLKLINVINPHYIERSPPKVFVSYDWNDSDFIDELTSELCRYDIYVFRDKKDFWKIGNDINEKVKEYINTADYFLIVSSESYVHKADNFKAIQSGVGYETMIFSQMIEDEKHRRKFLPLYLDYDNAVKDDKVKIPFYIKNNIVYLKFNIRSWKNHAIYDLVGRIRELYG